MSNYCVCGYKNRLLLLTFGFLMLVMQPILAHAQQDQGTIIGTVDDVQNRVIPKAVVTLLDEETGLSFSTATNESGEYVFTPVKVGRYTLSASAPGFSKTVRTGLELQIAQRLGVRLTLQLGSEKQTVEVNSDAPILQTEDASRGDVITSRELTGTPLLDRNYVSMAQLVAGTQEVVGSRGQDDFSANGMRPEQNNFILDGIDNNVNIVDYINGASFVVSPPPEALSEFKVQTSNYSAEFGHSAGATVNASIRSGTNRVHGSAWEFFRNNALDAANYFATTTPELRQNEFGAMLGGPILRNKLFAFGDYQGERIVNASTSIETVPTANMRNGNFSELLNPALTGGNTRVLYVPGTAGTVPQQCNGQANVLCPSQISPIAQHMLNSLPAPNYGPAGQTYNNFNVNQHNTNDTNQFDIRADWNISTKDQAFSRFSYANNTQDNPAPFGTPLSGGAYNNGLHPTKGRNFVLSETHEFNSKLVNEIRFGYNWLTSAFYQAGYQDPNIASSYGLGGIPSSAPINGGLPAFNVSGLSFFGAPNYNPIAETENVYELLDNITKVISNHTVKAGFTLQNIRNSVFEPVQARGTFNYDGKYTSNPAQSGSTGFGAADFLADYQDVSGVSNTTTVADWRWYRSAYAQDDWKLNQRMTVNLGLRYEYFQPYTEQNGRQALFSPNSSLTAATYYIPDKARNVPVTPTYQKMFAENNVQVVYTGNHGLVNAPKTNFAPRIGLAYSATNHLVVRAAYGIFYGGIENVGFSSNLGANIPFSYNLYLTSAGCTPTACPTNGIGLANGFSNVLANGIENYPAQPGLNGGLVNPKTTYVQQWNAAAEYQLASTLALDVAYVGSATRHIAVLYSSNESPVLITPGADSQAARPFPNFSGGQTLSDGASGNYNSLQVQLNKRLSRGLSFTSNYTYSHALGDDYDNFGGPETGTGYRNPFQLGLGYDYGTSLIDVRNRATVNLQYDLPFGRERQFLSGINGLENAVLGGWSTGIVFRAQTGEPVEIGPNNNPTNGVGGAMAYKVGDPFSTKLANPNTGVTCATHVKTTTTWFNPCAFQNPTPATGPNDIAAYGPRGRTEVASPGYNELDTSFFKSFNTKGEQSVQFRADIFNLFNHPSFGQPSYYIGSGFGQITGTRNGPRVIQLALKYSF